MVQEKQTRHRNQSLRCVYCMVLQNAAELKCLASTTISGDGIYAEYTYNGDKQELYEDVYGKITNTRHTEE